MTTKSKITQTSSQDSIEMIASFINAHPQGALTTIAKEDRLQSSVVNVFETHPLMYTFMTKIDTRKYNNIHKDNSISFITYDPFSRTEASIEGIAIEVTNKNKVEEILTKIRHDSQLGRWHVSPFVNEFDDYILFTIYPSTIHMTSFWEHESNIETFHEIIEFETTTE
jgi:general stress protein 26